LGTVFDGEDPSISRIAKTAGMNYKTVKKAFDVLKKDILLMILSMIEKYEKPFTF